MSAKSTKHVDTGILSPHRIEALTDGVFAIVMTLLVLELAIPGVHDAGAGGLWEEIGEIWSDILAYIMVFITLGILWLLHRFQFHYIKRSNGISMWLSIFFLASIALFPFSNSVLEYEESAAVIFYSINALVAMILLYLSWWHATSNRRLVDSDINQKVVRLIQRMPLIGIFGMIIACIVSVFSYDIALFLFIFLLALYIVMTAVWTQRLKFFESEQSNA